MSQNTIRTGAALLIAAAALWSTAASANPLAVLFGGAAAPSQALAYAPSTAPTDDIINDGEEPTELPAHLKRQIVSYPTHEAPGTVVIDTANTYLYLVMGGGKAMRYGIGVGRDGFRWSGVHSVTKKTEWPDWTPPAEMISRQPYLPRFVAGGPGNPLGARAMYIGNTIYRIHGTNAPHTIGGRVSSGCFRLVNEDVIDLYSRVKVGAKVVVLPGEPRRTIETSRAPQAEPAMRPVSLRSIY
jgi:lipoprotein-anchoring transpeptidase ErfK/SrfK